MFWSIWTILRELILSLAKVTPFVEMISKRYIVISNAVLWQHVFQVVVCVLGAVQRTASSTHTGIS